MKPQNPYAPPTEQIERPEDPAERERMDAEAAALAMKSDHQAFTGAATGVGSVEFDDIGAFGAGAKAETPTKGPTER
ncbi:MAG TPA: Tat pathway signal protein [Caulobacteraceae bacterium]|jgi:hypothetical protein